jgi:hypothetical protein
MIVMSLDGRLGNQLFQYACAMALAKRFRTIYLVDNDNRVDLIKHYFKVSLFNNNRVTRFLFNKIFGQKLPRIRQVDEAPGDILPMCRDNTLYKGYFQSEVFFENIKESIHRKLKIRRKFVKEFEEMFGAVFSNKILAIHYRLGDYLTWGSDELGGANLTLPATYYENALDKIAGLEEYTILVVTDDKENVLGRLPKLPNYILVSENEIIDFQVLMNADVVISSNSSFSWWASYLNNKEAPVYAPEFWLGFKVGKEYPPGVIPDRFISTRVSESGKKQ